MSVMHISDSKHKLCKFHLIKLQKDLDNYMDRYGIIYVNPKAMMIVLDLSATNPTMA
jgi:hypothetical protein